MDPTSPTSPASADSRCSCGCPCCSSLSFLRSVKRKADDRGRFSPPAEEIARIDAEMEVGMLRETLASQQVAIHDLSTELEEERNAAATAASETMSMILRLQHEKAEAKMEARQFRRFAEEKMAHDGLEIANLEDLLFKRDQEVEALSCEVHAYRHRLLSVGYAVDPPISSACDAFADGFDRSPGTNYHPLRCKATGSYDDDDDASYLEKHTPRTHEQIIYELKRTSPNTSSNPSPRRMRNSSKHDLLFGSKQSYASNYNMSEEDDGNDRVYTIDAVHGAQAESSGKVKEELVSMRLKEKNGQKHEFGEEGDEDEIKKLYLRLQALEADRESMRQAVMAMRSEKAQFVVLKEIAQQLYKEVKPERRIVKKSSLFGGFSFVSLIKCVISFLFWKKSSSRSRYTFGLSKNNPGLLQILEKSPQIGHWRCLTRTTQRYKKVQTVSS
ncbi:hypothetical protein HPP92_013932 [Vanilla planifolia]|uniref:GTD-binding domain-containing protein n=1 Tax=Vanilla planifolia TaxID=51239 RepID=A0A835QU05_VANPL|nr:hypothetical protein HPP92_013932 [Vanilla planifolia]